MFMFVWQDSSNLCLSVKILWLVWKRRCGLIAISLSATVRYWNRFLHLPKLVYWNIKMLKFNRIIFVILSIQGLYFFYWISFIVLETILNVRITTGNSQIIKVYHNLISIMSILRKVWERVYFCVLFWSHSIIKVFVSVLWYDIPIFFSRIFIYIYIMIFIFYFFLLL